MHVDIFTVKEGKSLRRESMESLIRFEVEKYEPVVPFVMNYFSNNS